MRQKDEDYLYIDGPFRALGWDKMFLLEINLFKIELKFGSIVFPISETL